jgi:hypothetical protein
MSNRQGTRQSCMQATAKTKFRRRLTCQGKLSHVVAAEANADRVQHSSLGMTHMVKEGAV